MRLFDINIDIFWVFWGKYGRRLIFVFEGVVVLMCFVDISLKILEGRFFVVEGF